MGKRVTLTSTKTDPYVPWYWQTADAANNQAWQQREQFLIDNPDITYLATPSDTTLTVVIEFPDDVVYDQFTAMTENIAPDVLAYCDANGITYTVVTEDI